MKKPKKIHRRKELVGLLASFFLFCLVLSKGSEVKSGDSRSIDWSHYETAISRARVEDKSVYLYFYTDQCPYCREMERETLSNPRVINLLEKHFFPVRIDASRNSPITSKFPIFGVPTSCFLNAQGFTVGCLPGPVQSKNFIKVLTYIGEGHFRDTTFKDYLKKNR